VHATVRELNPAPSYSKAMNSGSNTANQREGASPPLARSWQSIVVGSWIGLPGRTGPCRKILTRSNSALLPVRYIGRGDSVGLQRDCLFRPFARWPRLVRRARYQSGVS